MPSPSKPSAVLALFIALLTGGAHAASAEVPSWVPAKYVKFFHRSVDDRSTWEKALNFLDIQVRDLGPSFALVAGVSKYPKMGGRASDLWPARLDVEKMVAYLDQPPESFNEVVVLLDEDMTAENLNYFLTQYFPRRLAQVRHPLFLFAYSGHGITAPNGRGYILTSEAVSLDDHFTGAISLASLRSAFQEIVDAGYQTLALINACYGVDFHRLSLAFGPSTAPLPTREGAHAITAGGAGELTWQDPSFGDGIGPKGSIFFEAALAALDGRADALPRDGIITVGELETYLHTTVSRFTDEKQNPTGGDLLSARSPGGFFFLDRNRQMDNANAKPLKGEWWSGISFGNAQQQASADTAAAKPATPPMGVAALTGKWSGSAKEPGGASFPVELEVRADCAMNKPCGTIAVPQVPCRGRITLIGSRDDGFEFHVDQFDARSNKKICQPGAGEIIRALPDGTLSYLADYSGAKGVLKRLK